jgi:hypothetical protein
MPAPLSRPPVVNPFGNTVAGTPSDLWAVPTYLDSGFPAPAGVPVKPPLGFFNWLFWFLTMGVRYLLTRGIADWDASEDSYSTGAFVQATDGKIYKLTGTATTGTQPQSDLRNWQLWVASPIAAIAQYASEIWAWKNENGQRVFGISPDGLPVGGYDEWFENWMGADSAAINTGSGNFFGPWSFKVISTASSPLPSAFVRAPGAWQADFTNPRGSILELYCFGQSPSADLSIVESRKPFVKVDETVTIMETRLSLASNGGSGTKESNSGYAVGFGDGTLVALANTAADVPCNYGVWITAGAGATNWNVVTKNGSTSSSTPGPAIVADSPLRWRVVIVGDTVTNDLTPRVLHFINGALVANHPIDMMGKVLSPFSRATASQGETMIFKVGRLRMQTRLDLGDQLL